MRRLLSAVALTLIASVVSTAGNAADARHLEQVTTAAQKEEKISLADKPVLVLVTGKNCQRCEAVAAMLAAVADKYQNISIVTIDGGLDKPRVDFFVPLLQQKMFSIEDFNYDEKAVDGFLKGRDDFARQFTDTVKEAARVQESIYQLAHPFALRKQAIEAERSLALKDEIDATEKLRLKALEEIQRTSKPGSASATYEAAAKVLEEKQQPYRELIANIERQQAQEEAAPRAQLSALETQKQKLIAAEQAVGK